MQSYNDTNTIETRFELPDYLSRDCCEIISGILRRKPEWRLTMAQIRGCRWLTPVPWPSPDTTYRPLPLTRDFVRSGQRMTPHEQRVRESLTRLGVTPDLIEEHSQRGNRSQVIGAYRILLHRDILNSSREQQAQSSSLLRPSSLPRSDTPLVVVTSPALRNSRSLGSLRGDGSDGGGSSLLGTPIRQARRRRKKKRSKFCVIL